MASSSGGSSPERWLAELAVLRQELADLRREQRELAQAVGELTQTFKALATHLGVAAEPYKKAAKGGEGREIPGFG